MSDSTTYLAACQKDTAEAIAKSRECDEIVMAVRDGRCRLDAKQAFSILAALAAGRTAMRERQELRTINASLRAAKGAA